MAARHGSHSLLGVLPVVLASFDGTASTSPSTMSAASSSKTGKISSLGQGTHRRTPQQRCTMSNLLALCWQGVMFWLCVSAGLRCKYRIAATATFKGSESANPSCLRWYLLNFCSCNKATSADLVQSAERRVLHGNRWHKSLVTMSTIPHLVALASPWSLDMPIVMSNLLCAIATFGTSELLDHVILLRRELYIPFETNRDVSVTAQKSKQTVLSARQGCSTHAQQHTWGGHVCSSLHVAMVVASTHAHAIPACSIAMSRVVAEFVCPLCWTCWVAWKQPDVSSPSHPLDCDCVSGNAVQTL